jgi:hypothetical protein
LKRQAMRERKLLDRRIFERIPIELPLRFLDLASNREGLAQTHDINARGIGIITDEKVLPDTSLEIWLQTSNNDVLLHTRGMVVWSKQIEVNQHRIGINLEKVELMRIAVILRNSRLSKA